MFETILFYFLIYQKRIGLIWSYILKDIEFLIMEVSFNLGCTLKMHYFGEVYAIFKNILFSRLFSSLYLRLYLSFNVKK